MITPHVRYRYKPFYGSSHWWALRQCSTLPDSTRVLDVGSGSGAIGEALKMQGMEDLCAIEIDEQAREHIKKIYRDVAGDLNAFEGRTFDLILLLDVLEHMTDPAGFLSRVLKTLAPGGKVLISLPNVAHWSVRISLLLGVFDYTERGIMDRTHYQFFTRKRVREMFRAEPQLASWSIDSSIEPVEFLLPEPIWNNPLFAAISSVRLTIARLFPGLFAFQHLITATKAAS